MYFMVISQRDVYVYVCVKFVRIIQFNTVLCTLDDYIVFLLVIF